MITITWTWFVVKDWEYDSALYSRDLWSGLLLDMVLYNLGWGMVFGWGYSSSTLTFRDNLAITFPFATVNKWHSRQTPSYYCMLSYSSGWSQLCWSVPGTPYFGYLIRLRVEDQHTNLAHASEDVSNRRLGRLDYPKAAAGDNWLSCYFIPRRVRERRRQQIFLVLLSPVNVHDTHDPHFHFSPQTIQGLKFILLWPRNTDSSRNLVSTTSVQSQMNNLSSDKMIWLQMSRVSSTQPRTMESSGHGWWLPSDLLSMTFLWSKCWSPDVWIRWILASWREAKREAYEKTRKKIRRERRWTLDTFVTSLRSMGLLHYSLCEKRM